MAKNFEDFLASLNPEEAKLVSDMVLAEYGMEIGADGANIPLTELPYFLARLQDAKIEYYLRKYHEWMSS